ncbi:MAG: SpoIIE family protein phosphatase, partial [Acidobacteriota bacterium]
LTESVNEKEEQYGEKRLEEFLLKHRSKPIGDIHEKLHKSLEKFTGGTPQQDDLTLVLVKKTK